MDLYFLSWEMSILRSISVHPRSVASVVSDSLQLNIWIVTCQAPLSMGFFRQEYWRISCHSLFQEIFLIQGLNLGLLYCRWILYHWATREALRSFRLQVNTVMNLSIHYFQQMITAQSGHTEITASPYFQGSHCLLKLVGAHPIKMN